MRCWPKRRGNLTRKLNSVFRTPLTVSAAWPLWKEPCVHQRPAGSGRRSKSFEIRATIGRRMRTIAVIGTGFIGSVHARNAARYPGARLVAVYDANFESAKRIAGATGVQAVADVAEIFDNREIEAVVIATPTNTHVEYLRRAAQASKAIYCEKPIGLDYQEAEQAVSAVRAAGVPAMLGFNRRFDPNHAALREEVRRGNVGNLEIIQMTTRGPSLAPLSYLATSGGQLRDQTVHFFDLLRW